MSSQFHAFFAPFHALIQAFRRALQPTPSRAPVQACKHAYFHAPLHATYHEFWHTSLKQKMGAKVHEKFECIINFCPTGVYNIACRYDISHVVLHARKRTLVGPNGGM